MQTKYEKPQLIRFDQRFLVQGTDTTSCRIGDPEWSEIPCDIFLDPDNI